MTVSDVSPYYIKKKNKKKNIIQYNIPRFHPTPPSVYKMDKLCPG